MAIKKGNKAVTITLNPYHLAKLKELCETTQLSMTAVFQRLLEGTIQVKK